MKKTTWITLVLLLLWAFTFSACNATDTPPENHEQQPTIENSENSDNTPTEPPAPCQHTFGPWSVTKQANCTEDGKQTRSCSKCAAVETEAIPKNDMHAPDTDAAVPATCKAAGLTEGSHCALCGKVFLAQTQTEKLAHSFVENLCVCGTYKESIGLEFTKSGSTYTLSGIGNCQDARIVVPATYNGAPVTKIAEGAFASNNSFYEIILPSSITEIGAKAFSYCKGLKTIKIPSGVKYLERETFVGCTALESVVLSGEIIQILERCFASCTSLKQINLPGTLLKIWEYAFYNCGALEEIALPSSLNEIQQFAFLDCTSLTFRYLGMKWQFKQITKGFEWSCNTASCLVLCYDGEFDIFYD